jgi:hypothetical protein
MCLVTDTVGGYGWLSDSDLGRKAGDTIAGESSPSIPHPLLSSVKITDECEKSEKPWWCHALTGV